MKNIVLIGFMGSGKTVVARALASKLKMKIIDLDANIVRKAGMKIKYIFARYGEGRFRELETAEAKAASRKKGAIIAAGGGIVIRPENMAALVKNGIVVYLKNSFQTSYNRVKGDRDRPLFNAGDLSGFKRLFKKRQGIYRSFADVTVITDGKTVRQAADEIIRRTGEKLADDKCKAEK
jgi:shikimate kinase